VPYVNIWVEGKNIGTTANEEGSFNLPALADSAVLVLSAIGYQDLKVPAKNLPTIIFLQSIAIELNEVRVTTKKQQDDIHIGTFNKNNITLFFGTNPTAPWIVSKYYPYKPEYDSRFLKTITIYTRSWAKKNVTFNIRLYLPDSTGAPGTFLYDQNIICTAKKGSKILEADVSQLNIPFPKEGLFVAFEWLMIPENSVSAFINTNDYYQPGFGALLNDSADCWIYYQGKWKNRDTENKNAMVLACELIIDN